MNFQQLNYVCAVKEHGQFAKAAQACHVTQATLSGMIKKLEAELGYELFDRKHQPIQVTQLGEQFIQGAEQILQQQSALLAIGHHTLEHLEGPLTLGVIPTVANALLSKILAPLMQMNPKLELTILERTTTEIIRLLKVGEIDAGILATPLEDDRLSEHVLYYESMFVYGHSANKTYLSNKDILGATVWLLEEGHCFTTQAQSICQLDAKKQQQVPLQYKGGSFETLIDLTHQFGGITLIPELFAQTLTDQTKVSQFVKPVPTREISLVTYRSKIDQPKVDYLVEFIQGQIQPLLNSSRLKSHEMEIIGIVGED